MDHPQSGDVYDVLVMNVDTMARTENPSVCWDGFWDKRKGRCPTLPLYMWIMYVKDDLCISFSSLLSLTMIYMSGIRGTGWFLFCGCQPDSQLSFALSSFLSPR